MLVRSFIKFSEIHGVGCFTAEDIKSGQVVWKMDPVLDVEITEEQMSSYPQAVREFLTTYAYGQEEDGQKTYILCGDHARHMNHSDSPNLIEAGDGNALNIAVRDIKAGEELTCDYYAFDKDVEFKFKKRTT